METPFDGLVIAPHAPAQSSSGMEQLPYDVFINHHGGDAKHTIASSIYNKVDATGLRVFLDKYELELGDFIPGALKEAMSSSPIHIAIFSKNYAQSPWCLAELAFILQLPNIKFIPIFYHVEPSTLRWAIKGKGIYGEALTKHEMESRYNSEKLENWELALHKASFYTGEIINNEADEEAAVTKVVNLVLKELKKMRLDVAKHPVGLDELERDFHDKMTAFQSAAGSGPIQMVGIWGMGGAGKTTLAKHLFNKKSFTFGHSSFLSDVREAARKGQLHEKQKRLLEDLNLKGEGASFDNVDKGKEILRSRLRSVSVLVVIDDVDHTDQLDALLPARDSLGHGSLIIVATRELSVLKAWRVSAIYKIRALNATHAQQLFCWHAFGQPSPLVEFKELAQKFIKACHGLPLSLKVLGGLLCGESSKNYWQSQFDKLSRLLPDDIKSRLRISYDALDDEEKEMFLDIACFFIGWTSSRVIAVWDGSEWNGLHGWHRLVNKCLVELDRNNYIRMHDHLRDLGREIANKQSPYRLWSKDKIIEIQPQQEAVRVRGMAYAFGENCRLGQGEVIIKTNQGERSLQPGSLGLKIFIGDGDLIEELARELVCLQWTRFEHKNLPSWLSLKNLRILELSHPRELEGLWESNADAPLALRELIIKNANKLKKIESFKSLRSLEGLEIRHCEKLDGLAILAELTSLKKFELTWCRNLEKIEGLESLISLETLVIEDCTELNTLLNLAGLTSLQKIELKSCDKLKKIGSFKSLRSLEGLKIYDCLELDGLASLAELTSLKKFELTLCQNLEKIEGLESLISLETLVIYKCTELNTLLNLAGLTCLQKIELKSCHKLKKIGSLKSLRSLEGLEIYGCPELDGLASLAELTSLKKFELTWCRNLEKIEGLESLISLETLVIGFCTELNTLLNLAGLTSLQKIKLYSCNKLKKIGSLKSLRSLEGLEISGCPELDGLASLAELTSLKKFELKWCHKLEKIEGLESLISLETLVIDDCTELNTLLNLAGLTSLQKIKLKSCNKLKKIGSLKSLISLVGLEIYDCPELDGLASLAELTSLKQFELIGCHKLEKIEGLESLISLETLVINDCTELNTLLNLAGLTSLQKIKLKSCNKLKKMGSLKSLISLVGLEIFDCPELDGLASLAELTSLKQFELIGCHKLEKIEGLESLISLETLVINDCTELNTLLNLAGLTSLQKIKLKSCNKLKKMGSLKSLISLVGLEIFDCPELDGLASLGELTSLKKFKLIGCHKLEMEGLESLISLETLKINDCTELNTLPSLSKLGKLEVHTCLKAPPLRVNLEQRKGFKSLEVATNDISVVEAIISKMQTWPREVIICTRAVIDAGSLKNFFISISLGNVVEFGSYRGLKLWRPENLDNVNAILICFIIDHVYPKLHFHISTDTGNRFYTELASGKWLWMGVFPQGSNWLQSNWYEIWASSKSKYVKVKEAWLVMGEEGSIRKAFHRLSQS